MAIENVVGNVNALNIISEIRKTEGRLQQNIERISTGLRINSAKDNSGAFVLSQELDTQIRGLNRAAENVQQGVNFVNVALGGVDDILEIVQQIRTAALEAANSSAGDTALRTTLQSDIQERLQEIDKLTKTIKFNNQPLLNGTFASVVGFQPGTRDFGANVSFGPDATNLTQNGFFRIGQVSEGSSQIKSSSDTVFNTGIALQTDIAVTTAQFLDSGAVAATTVSLALDTFSINRVTTLANSVISFSGNLANGKTTFGGSLTIAGTNTLQDLIDTVQTAINNAENTVGVDTAGGTNSLETNVSLTGEGRLKFSSGQRGTPSQFDINFTLKTAGDVSQTNFGVIRDRTIFNKEVSVSATTGARIGNSTTAITGSTFEDGTFTIEVSSLTAANNQTIESNSGFFTEASLVNPVSTVSISLNNTFIGGISIEDGDTIEINGTDPDGTQFSVEFTVGASTGVGDAIVTTFEDLLNELNNRDRSDAGFGFNQAVASLNASGRIQITDDVAKTSSTDLTFTITESASSTAVTVNSTVTSSGTEEKANFSINGGETVTVNAGEVVTLFGDAEQTVTGLAPQVTIRAGRNITTGTDDLVNTADVFRGQLNGGAAVQFQNGDKSVVFFGNPATTLSSEQQQRVTLDFDSVVDITTPFADGGDTFVLSTNARTLNFQVGSESSDEKFFTLTDLRPENLGSGVGATLQNINVTTISGANSALDILDDAIGQITQVSSQFGAFASRLEDRANSLDFLSLNLENVRNQIISTDFTRETTELTQNTVLLEAQAAVLLQANATSQNVFRLLIGIQ